MKLLIWTQHYWPEHFAITALAGDLVCRGVEVTVLTGKPNYPEGRLFPGYRQWGIQRERHEGVDIVRIPLRPRGEKSSIGLALNYLSFIASGYLLAPVALRRERPDVVFVYATSPLLQALPALFFARLRGIPLVLWVQDLWPDALEATGHVRNRHLLRAVSSVVRLIYRRSDSILVQSEAFIEPVVSLGGGGPKLRYHPNSAEQPDMAAVPTPAAAELAAAMRRHFAVVFTGNVGQAQAMDTVLAAARLLRDHDDIRIYIVGSGSASAWLAQQVEQEGLGNLVPCGRFPASDMPTLMGAAEALLVSLGANPVGEKTVPSKIQSYLAAGRPVIASMNGEGARIVEAAGAGLACAAEDAGALAGAILALKGLGSEEREAMGRRGYAYFLEHFEAGRVNSALVAHFERIVNEGKQGR